MNRTIALLMGFLAFFPGTGFCAIVRLEPYIGQVLDQELNPISASQFESFEAGSELVLRPGPGGLVLQIDVLLRVSEMMAPAVQFGNAAFNVEQTDLLNLSEAEPGFQCDTTPFDINGPLLGGIVAKFTGGDCGDFVGDPFDLRGVLFGVPLATGAFDPRSSFGESAEGELIGYFYVEMPRQAGTSATLRLSPLGASVYWPDGRLTTVGVESEGGSLNIQIAAAAELPGDADRDGDVDIDDLNLVRNHFTEMGLPGLSGDTFPFDGVVNLHDLNAVRNQFGAAAAAVVPEPATAHLAFYALTYWAIWLARFGKTRRTSEPRTAP